MRLFSVDGGHAADITASDLTLAEASLCPGGRVILDDYFTIWQSVSEGASRYLCSGASKLDAGHTYVGNKFMITKTRSDRALPAQRITKRCATLAQPGHVDDATSEPCSACRVVVRCGRSSNCRDRALERYRLADTGLMQKTMEIKGATAKPGSPWRSRRRVH